MEKAYSEETARDCGLNSPEFQGLFSKMRRAKRYLLFWALGSRSDGSGLLQRSQAAGRPASTAPTRWRALGATRSSPKLLDFSFPATKRRAASTGRKRTATRSHLATLLDLRGNEGLGSRRWNARGSGEIQRFDEKSARAQFRGGVGKRGAGQCRRPL